MNLLAQTAELTEVAGKAIDASSGFGGEVWLLSIVLISVGALVGFYTWKIGIPNANAHRENTAKLSEAVSSLVSPIRETNIVVQSSDYRLAKIECALLAKATVREAEAEALEKIASHCGVNVSGELGRIRGAMAAAASILQDESNTRPG
jgi:hypothetical protein